jgi:hypothetical protein
LKFFAIAPGTDKEVSHAPSIYRIHLRADGC